MLTQIFHLFISRLHNDRRGSSQLFCKIGVSQYSEENTRVRVSFFINIVSGLQLQPIFIKKDALAPVFSLQLRKFYKNSFSINFEKKTL